MITKEQQNKINILIEQINNLESSDSSTMTSFNICSDLVEQKFDASLTYFDMCCGKGTILLKLYLKFWESLDIKDPEQRNKFIINNIVGNDISKAQVLVAKNTIKKIQKILKLKTILEPEIYNYDINDMKINKIINKFDVVITNPPYNSERKDNNQSTDIYPEFVEKAFELSKRYVVMITKSNWMIKPTQKKFRNKMITEFNVDKIIHYPENPFKGADIKGGVSYFVIDKKNTKNTFELNGVSFDRSNAIDFLPYDLNQKEMDVLNKILNLKKIDLSNFRAKSFYKIKSNDDRLKDSIETDNDIICHVSEQKGSVKYIKADVVNVDDRMRNDLNKYKIFTSSSYSPFKIGRIIKGHKELCSESLVNWVFEEETDRDNFYEYLNTKFFRFCISLINNKIDIGKNTFSLIPFIDYNKLVKIDDENIFEYFNFTEKEIEIIENRCQKLDLLK